jgi:GNAT superfamily N-acetyltransferase
MPGADVVVVAGIPLREEVLALYAAVGWTVYTDDPDMLAHALNGSSYVASARAGSELVALARAVSDDASVCFIQDVLVHPDWQRQGLGRRLVEYVLRRYRHVRRHVLLADDDSASDSFYSALGFLEVPTAAAANLRAYVHLTADAPPKDAAPADGAPADAAPS